MIRLLADENFNGDVLRGLQRRIPAIDVPRVQYLVIRGADDAAVLEWAAAEGRLVLTHDVSTRHASPRWVLRDTSGECHAACAFGA